MNNPFYKGTLLWDKLNTDLQRANSVKSFVENLKKLYVVYQEIW